ncbi:MAG: NAD(P)H-dependent oxidoreductase [Pseudomonadota bacterium]
MRVLVVFAHPVETSYQAALHEAAVSALADAGHEIDDCDLYAEDFDPVLSRAERLAYHDVSVNRDTVRPYVDRLLAADALVLIYPVWNFGLPAILKGFLDRVFLPGVSFKMADGIVRPCLHNIKSLCAITTYGGDRYRAFLVGDPPRRSITRVLRALIKPRAPVTYLAHYDMNRSTPKTRGDFLNRVKAHCRSF